MDFEAKARELAAGMMGSPNSIYGKGSRRLLAGARSVMRGTPYETELGNIETDDARSGRGLSVIPEVARDQFAEQMAGEGAAMAGPLKVVSLFDGLGGARLALNRLGRDHEYVRAEVDPSANAVHEANFPGTKNLGDVRKADFSSLKGGVDCLIGGSPCQDLSRLKAVSGDRAGLAGDKSSLFWEYVRAMDEAQPDNFVFENVSGMPARDMATISSALGVDPVLLDAAKVSGVRRPRLFWSNMKLTDLPETGGQFADYLDAYRPDLALSQRAQELMSRPYGQSGATPAQRHLMRADAPKGPTLTARLSNGVPNNVLEQGGLLRHLSPEEVERLMGVPEGFTSAAAKTQRLKMLGNGYSVPVMTHVLSHLP